MTQLKRQFDYRQTYHWTQVGLKSIRRAMQDLNFNEIVPSILSCELEPGAFHSYAVVGDKIRPEIKRHETENVERQVQVTGKEFYYLPVSHNFEKQQAVEFLNKVYCLAPCVRLLQRGENISRKHLNTFFQVEVEWNTQSIQEVFATAQSILTKTAGYLLDDLKKADFGVSEVAQRNVTSILKGAFPQITFSEALSLVGADPGRRTDLTFDEDQLLSSKFDRPFWIHNYPKGVRDAVYKENDQGNFDTYDLMLPFGYGEISTGGIRPNSGDAILKQSVENLNEPIETLTTGHAEWKRTRKIQTAGFGIGFERFLRFISGSQTVLDFVQMHDHGPNRLIEGSF